MEFNFDDPPALVQVRKKYAHFRIREIGGPDEIKKEREIQAAKEATYRIRLGDREARAAVFAAGIGQKVAEPTIHTSSWQEKVAFANSERDRLAKAEDAVSVNPPWISQTPIKKSIYQRIKGFLMNAISQIGANR